MIILLLNTPSFTFTAMGNDDEEAKDALLAGWLRHAKQTGADPSYLGDNCDDIRRIELEPGLCTRDYELV